MCGFIIVALIESFWSLNNPWEKLPSDKHSCKRKSLLRVMHCRGSRLNLQQPMVDLVAF